MAPDPFIRAPLEERLALRLGLVLGRGGNLEEALAAVARSLVRRLERTIVEQVGEAVGGGVAGALIGGLAGGLVGGLLGAAIGRLLRRKRRPPVLRLPELEQVLAVSFPTQLVPASPSPQPAGVEVRLSLEGVVGDPDQVARAVSDHLESTLRTLRLAGG